MLQNNCYASLFRTSSFLMFNFKCKAKLANESTPKYSVCLSLPFFLPLSLFPPPCLSRVPVAMVIWHASRGGQMRRDGGGWRWPCWRTVCLINHNSNSWIVEYFVSIRHLRKRCLSVCHWGSWLSLFSCHRRHGDTFTLCSASPECQLVASLSRLAPVKSDI